MEEKKMSNKYVVSVKSPLSPKVKIFGLSERLEPNVIEDALKRQNGFLANGVTSVLKVTQDVKNQETFNAIVQVDKNTFEQMMKKKKVLINWDSCHLYTSTHRALQQI